MIGTFLKSPKPFLRWAGGKRWILKHLDAIENLEFNSYHEPFLGGGSVFFNIKNRNKAYLSDLNSDLIEAYKEIRDNTSGVIDVLKKLKNTEKDYYKIRSTEYENSVERAAKFIYLNRTSYNGIYRVNRSGVFNVPYGFREIEELVDEANLYNVSKILKGTIIKAQDFEKSIEKVKPNDLVFLDPPYTVAHENNGFIAYNQKIFSIEDQCKLAKLVEHINSIGAHYVLTNAKHDAILDIYKNVGEPIILSRSSTVGGIGARREEFKEYVFSNCL